MIKRCSLRPTSFTERHAPNHSAMHDKAAPSGGETAYRRPVKSQFEIGLSDQMPRRSQTGSLMLKFTKPIQSHIQSERRVAR